MLGLVSVISLKLIYFFAHFLCKLSFECLFNAEIWSPHPNLCLLKFREKKQREQEKEQI